MSFDDLIGLFIFLLFVGVPLVNRLRRSGRSNRPPPQTQSPQRPAGSDRQRGSGDSAPAQSFDPDDPIGRQLAEARRRVEQARGSGSTASQPTLSGSSGAPTTLSGSSGTPTTLSGSTAPPTLSGSRAPASAPATTSLLRPPQTQAIPPSFIPPPAFAASRGELAIAEPLKVAKRKGARAAARAQTKDRTRSKRRSPLLFGSDDIVRGILWHQILNEPVAHEHLARRRTPFQRPSR